MEARQTTYLLETIFRIIFQSFDESRQHFRCEHVMIPLISGECTFYLRQIKNQLKNWYSHHFIVNSYAYVRIHCNHRINDLIDLLAARRIFETIAYRPKLIFYNQM